MTSQIKTSKDSLNAGRRVLAYVWPDQVNALSMAVKHFVCASYHCFSSYSSTVIISASTPRGVPSVEQPTAPSLHSYLANPTTNPIISSAMHPGPNDAGTQSLIRHWAATGGKVPPVWRTFFARSDQGGADNPGEVEPKMQENVNIDVFSLEQPSWYVVAASETKDPGKNGWPTPMTGKRKIPGTP